MYAGTGFFIASELLFFVNKKAENTEKILCFSKMAVFGGRALPPRP
jgi:hypothetical protein